jgi:predicted DNA-binding protein (MmcQ/YjbR family)
MGIDFARKLCLSFPHVTETVQWGDNLVFKVGGKIFAILSLEPDDVWLSFKCSDEDFASLTERTGIIPAPYLARAHWVALESEDAMPAAELRAALKKAYGLIFEKLPRKTLAQLAQEPAAAGAQAPSPADRPQRRSATRKPEPFVKKRRT